MKNSRSFLLAAAALFAASAMPASATAPADRNPHSPGLGWGPPQTRGVPGPLLGAGLPILVVAAGIGVYRVVRKRRAEAERSVAAQQG